MQILDEIISILPDGNVTDVRIGLHWTAVVVETEGDHKCGLASTLVSHHDHQDGPLLPQAGALTQVRGRDLAALALAGSPLETSIGLATINALLPRQPELWQDENAEDVIARFGEGRRVALIGHFPFVATLRSRVGELTVLELNPREGDLPAEAAPQVLPESDVIAITGMTIANRTLEGLLKLCPSNAHVLILGPSTPLTPLFFNIGVDVISGAIVTNIEPVLRIVSQGGNFRQVHRGGVRLVNMHRGRAV